MKGILGIILLASLAGCASTPTNEAVKNESPVISPTNEDKPLVENVLLSEYYGLLTQEQSQHLQDNMLKAADKAAIAVWPVYKQNAEKLNSIYDPNFIVSSFQFSKELKLAYQESIYSQIQLGSKLRLAGEELANLHFYTLFSTMTNDSGDITIEYFAGASDWSAAKQRKDLSELKALLDTTIWTGLFRKTVEPELVMTDGQLDERKLSELMIKMSTVVMQKFLVLDEG